MSLFNNGTRAVHVEGIIVPVDQNGDVRFDLISAAWRPANGERFGIFGGWECAQPSGGHPIKGTYWSTFSPAMQEAWSLRMDEQPNARRMIASAQMQGYRMPKFITENATESFVVDTNNPTAYGVTNAVPYKQINPLTRFYQQAPQGQCYVNDVKSVVLLIGVYRDCNECLPVQNLAFDYAELARQLKASATVTVDIPEAKG
jgi:hypothetical protein